MKLLPEAVQFLVNELSKWPGVGGRTALRYAVSLVSYGNERISHLQRALEHLQKVRTCKICNFWTDSELCPLCDDAARSNALLCVVRDSPDVLALEKQRRHPWRYHILQGLLAPLSSRGPQDIQLKSLFERIEGGEIRELILALDATLEGDATAFYIHEHIKNHFPGRIKVTRIAMGLPAGASVEYLDPSTLENALLHRMPLE